MHTLSRADVVCQYRGLVWKIARKFFRSGLDPDDLFQEGCIGLIKAYDLFDPDRGAKFMTYAYPWIYAAIQAYVESLAEPVRFSHGCWMRLRAGTKEQEGRSSFACRLNSDPDEFLKQLPHRGEFDEQTEATRHLDRQIIYETLMYLPVNQQRVLINHFFDDQNFASISEELGLTKQRAHQIFQEGIQTLRKKLRLHRATT